MVIKAVLLALIGVVSQAGTLALKASSSRVSAGGKVTLHLNYSASDTAALGWTLKPPAGVLLMQAPGPRAKGKTLSCLNGKCALAGLNQTIMQAGEVATYTATFTFAGPVIGFILSDTIGADPKGGKVIITVSRTKVAQ